jgi:acetyl esterase/lipase
MPQPSLTFPTLPIFVWLLACAFVSPPRSQAEEPTFRDVEYAKVGDHSLKLDLYLPESSVGKKPPLIVWVHGGAWRAGSKEKMPLGSLTEHGYAIASINYRLSPVAKFPAQVHDIKAAIRFLRAQRDDERWHYDKEKIIIAGASAGGHLAALVGVTNGHEELEGSVGEFDSESSDVVAIIDFYGPTNFLTILKQSTPHGLGVRIPALQLLLGAQPENTADLAKLASPVFHVDDNDPPLLMIHGDQDPQVPINQSHELEGAYQRSGSGERVQFEVIHGGQHGGEEFYDAERIHLITEFLSRVLK